MKAFKKRWEITKDWQLIHPILGLIASFFCGYLIAKAVVKAISSLSQNYQTFWLIGLTLLVTYGIIKISLWLFSKLYKRWKVSARWELIALFLVFAITGSTAGKLSDPLMQVLGLDRETTSGWIYWPVRIIIIFPIYQILLVIFGWLFGQFAFFKEFAIKMASRMGFGFLFKTSDSNN
ncbi:MAG: prolipoprotein diacylglyceryl transferase [Cytophagaceae bacterium]|nr:prolipoprotein diacylglyceryl transferase [Cytophagaceae bacterium]